MLLLPEKDNNKYLNFKIWDDTMASKHKHSLFEYQKQAKIHTWSFSGEEKDLPLLFQSIWTEFLL